MRHSMSGKAPWSHITPVEGRTIMHRSQQTLRVLQPKARILRCCTRLNVSQLVRSGGDTRITPSPRTKSMSTVRFSTCTIAATRSVCCQWRNCYANEPARRRDARVAAERRALTISSNVSSSISTTVIVSSTSPSRMFRCWSYACRMHTFHQHKNDACRSVRRREECNHTRGASRRASIYIGMPAQPTERNARAACPGARARPSA